MIRALAACLVLASPVYAQETVSPGTGAVVRVLDKLTGEVLDLNMPNGAAHDFGRIAIEMRECRYPEGNPAGDAYAFVTVSETEATEPVYSGWLVASSPALNPMDHPRYDVWALRCTTS